jgi:hypothetical protein
MSKDDSRPDEWLCAAISVGDADKAFRIVSIENVHVRDLPVAIVRVLRKETGAVWKFQCSVEREGVK